MEMMTRHPRSSLRGLSPGGTAGAEQLAPSSVAPAASAGDRGAAMVLQITKTPEVVGPPQSLQDARAPYENLLPALASATQDEVVACESCAQRRPSKFVPLRPALSRAKLS